MSAAKAAHQVAVAAAYEHAKAPREDGMTNEQHRHQLAREVAEADRALNMALREARRKLLAA